MVGSHSQRGGRRLARLSALVLVLCPLLQAETASADSPAPPADTAPAEQSALVRFINRMPELINQALPELQPGGAYWLYARPRFGNPFRGGFFRIDFGGWLKVTDHLALNAGAQSYLGRDKNDNNTTRDGFYGVNTGIKYERPLSDPAGSAMSTGLNFTSPVSRPPINLTDGHRHTDPYFSYSRPLDPKTRLVGFVTVGADFLSRSGMPSNFGTNQLHSNSENFSVGVSRPWKKFSGSLTFSGATTALLSKSTRQVFSLNPQVFIPLFPNRIKFARVTLALSTRVVVGPDGRQFGSGASLHWDLRSRPYGKIP